MEGMGSLVHAEIFCKSERQMTPSLALLLISLGERIRLDQVGGFIDQLVLAVRLGFADAGLRQR